VRGKVDLKTAQREIAEDWISPYEKYIGPLSTAPPTQSVQGHRADDVWVNSHSGKYFTPGSQWYGKSKSGEYMSESEAIQISNPARNLVFSKVLISSPRYEPTWGLAIPRLANAGEALPYALPKTE
jgi:hypothetical protein